MRRVLIDYTKNKTLNSMKHIVLASLALGLFGCATGNKTINCNLNNTCLNPWSNSSTAGISNSMKFDYLLDGSITAKDPRIQSLIRISKENTGSELNINYSNIDCKQFAQKLYNIFKENKVTVNNPVNQKNNSLTVNQNSNIVKVLIKFNMSTYKNNIKNVGINK